ncbi:MAG: type II toxin-antitoxin system Phd/YefM family antitoxin, partial [Myxococcota bacterium]
LKRLAAGERIILCLRNVPIAEIRPLPAVDAAPRPIGLARGRFAVPSSFFEPLADDVAATFEGSGA